MLFLLLGLHLLVAAVAPLIARRIYRRVLILAAVAPALSFAWGIVVARSVVGGEIRTETLKAAPSLSFELALRLDPFGLLMWLVVSGIGVLVFIYSYSYFSEPRSDLGKYTAELLLFSASMLGLVVSDHLLGLFLFWEATGIASYLLIGFNDKSYQARAAALQAILTTGLGGLAMLGGFVIVGRMAGTYSISELLYAVPSGRLVDVGLVCILLGAFTKSAQAPFHAWLPSAMSAPTPVSAYLHSATMVKAGVFLVARLSPAFGSAGVWRPACVTVGLTTMIIGAYRALRQFDLKLLLAYGTISQLGLMIALFGAGSAEAARAGITILIAHAAYKAALFMSAGAVEKAANTRDIRRLDNLGSFTPLLFGFSAVSAASMAGIPPTIGFIAKDETYSALLSAYPTGGRPLFLAAILAVVASSSLTVAYSARFLKGAFGKRTDQELTLWNAAMPETLAPQRPDPLRLAPIAILAFSGVVTGILPASVAWLAGASHEALYRQAEAFHLRLWHGLGLPLLLSAVSLSLGLLLTSKSIEFERLQKLLPRLPGSLEAYRVALDGLLRAASRITGLVQAGSLPLYLSVIAATLVVLPSAPLVMALARQHELSFRDNVNPMSLVVATLIVVAVAGVLRSRRRFTAVLMLGAVGYGVGTLFAVWGGPDLAITQFLIETLMIIIFVLVLRNLPPEFPAVRFRGYTVLRAMVSVLVGLLVLALTALSVQSRRLPSISSDYLARALPEGHGRNVVNLIVVDFRALDTLGEITVLAVAAVGVASLVMAGRSRLRSENSGAPVPSGSREVFE